MTKGLKVNIEVKPKWWLKPVVKIIGLLYDSNLIQKRAVEASLSRVMNSSFKFRMDKGKWQKLDMQHQVELTE